MDVKKCNCGCDKSIKERDTGNIDKIPPPPKNKKPNQKQMFIQNNSKSKNNKKKKSIKGY